MRKLLPVNKRATILLLLTQMVLSFGCNGETYTLQGYVEGEFVNVASPRAGALEKLNVVRGQQVAAGDPLFTLERGLERAARDVAARRLDQARSTLEDVKKGLRPTELAALEAQIEQAKAALSYSSTELRRQEQLYATKATSKQDVDRMRSLRDQDQNRVLQLLADNETAKLGSRSDQIAAAQANVQAAVAELAQAQWDLDQKSQFAPSSGLLFDTLYREGEWVNAGRPVVSLLPPANIKVRTFVPEQAVGRIVLGAVASISVDGVDEPFKGKVSYISPQAEYTPPVIYSRESREKLVFMVEISFEDLQTAAKLHPGQPVDVQLSLNG